MDDPSSPLHNQIENATPHQLAALLRYGASGSPVSGEPPCTHGGGAAPPSSSSSSSSSLHLNTQKQASESNPIASFMAEKPGSTSLDPVLDELSLSSNFRHSGWRPMRRQVFDALGRTKQAASRVASFATCGSFTTIERSEIDHSRFRLRCNHCHDRLCTPCANARSWRLQQALLTQYPVDGALFITLTLCGKKEPLHELIDRLYKSFRYLRSHPVWSDRITGGAAFLEVKWSDKAQRWHPHLHIVAEGRYIDQGELSDAWRSITKDSYIVDVRRIREKAHAARYVTKYASKPLNTSFCNTPRLLDEAITALKGRRLCLCFGSWYGTPLDLANDELLADDEVDAGSWTMWLPLETVLSDARSGDPEAIAMIRALDCESLWRASLTPP